LLYLAYKLYPGVNFWNEAFGDPVRLFIGRQYSIAQPHDLWSAIADVISRALAAKTIRVSNRSAAEQ
jgi:hypothetical protein